MEEFTCTYCHETLPYTEEVDAYGACPTSPNGFHGVPYE